MSPAHVVALCVIRPQNTISMKFGLVGVLQTSLRVCQLRLIRLIDWLGSIFRIPVRQNRSNSPFSVPFSSANYLTNIPPYQRIITYVRPQPKLTLFTINGLSSYYLYRLYYLSIVL